MKRIAVIYASKYGFTKKYAQWIAQDLQADIMETNQIKVNPNLLDSYQIIIFGGGLYAGGMNGISLITKNFSRLCNKELYLFTVGAADVADGKNIATIRKNIYQAFTPEMRQKIQLYHFRGGLNYPKMSLLHRMMMCLLVKKLRKRKKEELTGEEAEMLSTYGQKIDFTERRAIAPLVEEIRRSEVI
ncbi:flavodoxin [Clostridium sp. D2Q-14]|uniref:flavodoxin domain-containing protein n=1 Tax=Anaeromonas gelatinilytica TaxID=2683194 RepID=UPI00193AFBE4|nr:flavodoxin domain-containing protein [Anaeromonas gelatinilytica]MBS4534383.1 flavodoxin [Anaeromonas gelatinilytica]